MGQAKRQYLMISEHSPHLEGVLKRRLTGADPTILETTFGAAIEFGGKFELDFEREEGVSFNPRPARIALILLNDAGIDDSETIAAAFLTSVWSESEDFQEHVRSAVPSPILQLAAQVHQAMAHPAQLPGLQCNPPAAKIALALWLDRARHLHQIPDSEERSALWLDFLGATNKYLELALECAPGLHVLLNAWSTRFRRRLQKS